MAFEIALRRVPVQEKIVVVVAPILDMIDQTLFEQSTPDFARIPLFEEEALVEKIDRWVERHSPDVENMANDLVADTDYKEVADSLG